MRALLAGLSSLLLLPVLVLAAATGSSSLAQPIPTAVADIPADYLVLYQQAAVAYELPWELLAAIGKVECDHGRAPDPACSQHGFENEAGAGGPRQVLAATWRRYGADGDNDGSADRWNPADAIPAAANYLAASGAPDQLERAIYAYNHSTTYVIQVRAWMQRYTDAAAAALDTAALPDLTDRAALAQAVLGNPRIELRPEARLDIETGRADARVLGDLLALSQKFLLAHVGPIITGHAHNVHGTDRASNHAFGRAVDIGAVNGTPVDATNDAARAAVLALAALPPPLRPDEIGSPFADVDIGGAFSDSDHDDHIHIGFDQ
jgi:hypothetical protein